MYTNPYKYSYIAIYKNILLDIGVYTNMYQYIAIYCIYSHIYIYIYIYIGPSLLSA